MKNLIAIIFVIIMIYLDNKDFFKILNFKYLNFNKNNIENYQNKLDIKISENKINVWLFYTPEMKKYNSDILLNICYDTIKYNLNSNYNIISFNIYQVGKLLPEYLENLNQCKCNYVLLNLIKYTILRKYGGLWIRPDTIMLNKMIIPNEYLTKLIIFGDNNTKYVKNIGYNDDILYSFKNNNVISSVCTFIQNNLIKFNYSNRFDNFINSKFNLLLDDADFIYKSFILQKNIDNKFLSKNIILKTYYHNIDLDSKYVFYTIDLIYFINNLNHNYILKMNIEELLNSKMFISSIIRYAFNLKCNLNHITV